MKYTLRTLWFLAIFALVAACSPSASPTTRPITKTSAQMSWFHTIEWAGFFFAKEQGLYTNEALDVTLLEGGLDAKNQFIDPVEMVLSGKADFGVYGSDSILKARAAGKPIIGIAAIYQTSARALVSLADKNIKRPQDLVGKTVMISDSEGAVIGLNILLERAGVDPKSVKIIRDSNKVNDAKSLTSGEADAVGVFITNQAVDFTLQGLKLNNILYADYGADAYSNVIFTTEKILSDQPDLVERFLRATLRGYQAAAGAPEQAAKYAVQYAPKLNYDSQLASMRAALPLIQPAGSKIGQMRAELWQLSYDLLRKANILTETVDVSKAFSMTIVEKITKPS